MTGKLHRAIALLAAVMVMLAGIVIITDPLTLGISANVWKLVAGWTALSAGVLSGFATVLRANMVPGVTTGVGNEPPQIGN